MSILEALSANVKKVLQCTTGGALQTSATTKSKILAHSFTGNSYVWESLNTDIDANDVRLFLKNTGTKHLVLTHAIINSSNVACSWSFGIGNEATAPVGTILTATKLTRPGSTTLDSYSATDDETALSWPGTMFTVTTPLAFDSRVYSLDGIILDAGEWLMVRQLTESTSGQVSLFGYFTETLE